MRTIKMTAEMFSKIEEGAEPIRSRNADARKITITHELSIVVTHNAQNEMEAIDSRRLEVFRRVRQIPRPKKSARPGQDRCHISSTPFMRT